MIVIKIMMIKCNIEDDYNDRDDNSNAKPSCVNINHQYDINSSYNFNNSQNNSNYNNNDDIDDIYSI